MSANLIFILSALLIAALLTLMIMPYSIDLFIRLGLGKNIRSEGLIGVATEFAGLHAKKKGTPTMGGVILIGIILLVVIGSIVIQYLHGYFPNFVEINIRYTLWNRNETYLVLFTLVSVGVIGMIDDYLNIREIGRTKGLSAKLKMLLLVLFAFLGAYWFYSKLGHSEINIPGYGHMDLGWGYIPVFILIFVATANSVNITDGLDGLAGGLLLFNFLAYGVITYMQGMFILSALCLIIVGTLMGFLWFNIHPAKIFMGDTGSLAFGATLAVIALMTDTILAFIVMNSIFIFETLSVLIQMMSKKFRNGKKIFRIAPFHHHLEAIGWEEETIVMKFWLIGMLLTAIGVILVLIGMMGG